MLILHSFEFEKNETYKDIGLLYVFKNATKFGKHCKLHIHPNFKAKLANIKGISQKRDVFNIIKSGALVDDKELEDLLNNMNGKIIY